MATSRSTPISSLVTERRSVTKLDLSRTALRWRILAIAAFIVLWAGLNACLNLHYPGIKEIPFSWMLPSVDVTVLFVAFAIAGWAGRRIPGAVFYVLAAFFVFARVFRLADAISWKFMRRHFNVYLNLSSIPELGRLLISTMGPWIFVLVLLAFAVVLALLFAAVYFALRFEARFLVTPEGRRALIGSLGILGLASFVVPSSSLEPRRTGVFLESFTVRLAAEVDYLANVSGLRAKKIHEIERTSDEVGETADDFARLGGADVFVFFVESYGHAVVERLEQRRVVGPIWDRLDQTLAGCGYGVRSHFLVSSTYGGGSWLAHATFNSGARIGDEFDLSLLLSSKVKPLVTRFRQAGYRTINLSPATTREPVVADGFFAFEEEYNAVHFDYRGPPFSWATMPDQFVLDRLHRRILAPRPGTDDRRPRFVQTILISSHAPFDRQPPYVEDWERLGDGSLFHTLDPVLFDLRWTDQSAASTAYTRSLTYDFQVLEDCFCRLLTTDGLLIVLGDHQPNADVSGGDESWAVPIHVLSRNPELLRPFDDLGYVKGFTPTQSPPYPGMEAFYPQFIRGFRAKD